MGQLNRFPRRSRNSGLLIAGIAAILGVTTGGCRHSDDSGSAAPAPPPAAATANSGASDQGFQSNPNVPPQVKAAIAAREHGKAATAPSGK